jgi:hypothetical protein
VGVLILGNWVGSALYQDKREMRFFFTTILFLFLSASLSLLICKAIGELSIYFTQCAGKKFRIKSCMRDFKRVERLRRAKTRIVIPGPF